ncbi:hypothetical protein C6P42_003730 [Pichia californica]|nr:hypothetical protein C6P42_003730 [[Candida] californica]
MPSSEDENDNSMNAWAQEDSFFENNDITEIEEYFDLISSKEFLAKYLDVSKVYDKFYFNALKFWFKNKKKFPYSSKLAQRCLIGTSSSCFSIIPLRLNSINESRIINVERLEISLKSFKDKFGDGHVFADEATFRRGLR